MNQKEKMLNGLPYKAWLDGVAEDNVVAVGNPCRVLREITEEDRDFYFTNNKFDVTDYECNLMVANFFNM